MQTSATPIVGKLLMLGCFGLAASGAAATRRHDEREDNYDLLLSWLRQPAAHPQGARLVLPEDSSYQQRATFGAERSREIRTDRSLLPEYRQLCETVTRKLLLNSDPNYEYQPPHYYEVFCKSYSLAEAAETQTDTVPAKQKCAHPSFHCVQRSRTLFALRRRWDGQCWEPATKVVASGCDCMWPTSTLGDVSIHY